MKNAYITFLLSLILAWPMLEGSQPTQPSSSVQGKTWPLLIGSTGVIITGCSFAKFYYSYRARQAERLIYTQGLAQVKQESQKELAKYSGRTSLSWLEHQKRLTSDNAKLNAVEKIITGAIKDDTLSETIHRVNGISRCRDPYREEVDYREALAAITNKGKMHVNEKHPHLNSAVKDLYETSMPLCTQKSALYTYATWGLAGFGLSGYALSKIFKK